MLKQSGHQKGENLGLKRQTAVQDKQPSLFSFTSEILNDELLKDAQKGQTS